MLDGLGTDDGVDGLVDVVEGVDGLAEVDVFDGLGDPAVTGLAESCPSTHRPTPMASTSKTATEPTSTSSTARPRRDLGCSSSMARRYDMRRADTSSATIGEAVEELPVRIAMMLNCQAPLWRESVQALTSGRSDVVVTRSDHIGASSDLRTAVENARDEAATVVLIVDAIADDLDIECTRAGYRPDTIVKVPGIVWGAFHPDVGYARLGDGSTLRTAWNTELVPRLALTAMALGLSADEALMLYSPACFQNVGYLDHWEPSVQAMRRRFDLCGLDFRAWYQAVKRRGVFMHGINHPRPFPVAALAEQVCRDRLGLTTCSAQSAELTLSDVLADQVIWPVHAPVATHFGVPASDVVKVRGSYVPWSDFVTGCCEAWSTIDLTGHTMPPDFTSEQRRFLVDYVKGRS